MDGSAALLLEIAPVPVLVIHRVEGADVLII